MEWSDSTTPHSRPPATDVELLLGLWMRLAVVGAACVAAGVALLMDPPQAASFTTPLLWIVLGALVGWIGWQRTKTLLDQADVAASFHSSRDDAPALRSPAVVARRRRTLTRDRISRPGAIL